MERKTAIGEVARPETVGSRKWRKYKYDVVVQSMKRKEEVKKEFQDYLNNSCDVWKRKEKE